MGNQGHLEIAVVDPMPPETPEEVVVCQPAYACASTTVASVQVLVLLVAISLVTGVTPFRSCTVRVKFPAGL